jgi:hypothetical protein
LHKQVENLKSLRDSSPKSSTSSIERSSRKVRPKSSTSSIERSSRKVV